MLERRLRHFDIFFNDGAVKVDHVTKAFETEPNGPGKLLGYRAMYKKIRQEHGLNVIKDRVFDVMNEQDPDGFEARGCVDGKKFALFPF